MPSRRVLLTGLSTFWGGRLAQCLERDAGVETIIGASGGTAPEWLDTSRAPPASGTCSMPSTSQRNHNL